MPVLHESHLLFCAMLPERSYMNTRRTGTSSACAVVDAHVVLTLPPPPPLPPSPPGKNPSPAGSPEPLPAPSPSPFLPNSESPPAPPQATSVTATHAAKPRASVFTFCCLRRLFE